MNEHFLADQYEMISFQFTLKSHTELKTITHCTFDYHVKYISTFTFNLDSYHSHNFDPMHGSIFNSF